MKNIVGVDIGGTKMYMVAKVGDHYEERKVATGIACSKAYIKNELENFIKALPFEIDGVGMALPGLVLGDYELERSDVVPSLNGVTTEYFAEGRFPMCFINDVKAATFGESSYYPEADTVAVMMVGTGIAVGISSQGTILQGAKGFAGEMGNIYIPYKEGMEKFDVLSGGASILQRAGCGAEELLEKLKAKDANATKLIEQAGYYFGLGLAMIIQFYNPDVIVVGGSTSTYEGYMEMAEQTAKQYTLPELYKCCEIVRPRDMNRVVALGAAKFMESKDL